MAVIEAEPPATGFEKPPRHERLLRAAIRELTGVRIANRRVCANHTSPWSYFSEIYLSRPQIALILGPRGGGKSYLSALDTHLRSRWTPGYATRILGGSKAQSAQVYQALRDLIRDGNDQDVILRLLKEGARYKNGSDVEILAASSTSVRGPHVPSLKLDEVDEIDPDCREAAMGMCMNRKGEPASVVMTSTWHRVGGPMAELIERGRGGEFPYYAFCAFEVLERCPDERSGANLEKCPQCPLVSWCHDDRDLHPSGLPKAKRSSGHYSIDALIQKVRATSKRTFESDYLCKGPRAEGAWFHAFDPPRCLSERAEYDPAWSVQLAIDPGVFTGAVFLQLVRRGDGARNLADDEIHVFSDYLVENIPAEQVARDLVELARVRCGGRLDAVWMDPAGTSRTSVGPTVLGELERGGLTGLRSWPRGAVADGLALVESFLTPADGRSRLLIHPRCGALVTAIAGYRRARRGGQWQDYPEDPQHPQEDLVDALRGGLKALFPEGRRSQASLPRISARQVF